jgi:hypothetical protein
MRFTDAYADKPTTPRDVLVERLRCLRMQSWADPGDTELRAEIEQAEDELRRFDAAAWGRSR